MKENGTPLFIISVIAILFAGCAKQQQLQPIDQIYADNLQKTQVMQIAEKTLTSMHFDIKKADTEQGIIRTKPLTGAQFFEFWRSDNAGSFNSAESNLHTIRRIANISITPQNAKLSIKCDVKTSKLSLPERPVTSTGQTYQIFSKSKTTKQTLKLDSRQQENLTWIDLPDDKQLATKILNRLKNQIEKQQEKGTL